MVISVRCISYLYSLLSLISFCCDLRPTAYSRTMLMEPSAFMLLLFKWRTSSMHHPQWQWAVYQFSSLFKFKRSPSHLVWLIQPLWEPLLQMDPALLLEALTKNGSLPGVEEMLQRESQHHAWTHWLPHFLLNLIIINFDFMLKELILVEEEGQTEW